MGVVDKLMGLKLFPFKDLWQDREVRFDCSKRELSFRPGETLLECIDDVEDTKGHNGVAGELLSACKGSLLVLITENPICLQGKLHPHSLHPTCDLPFAVTNLRLLWWSKKRRGSNISVGYNCFTSLATKSSRSRLQGNTESLHILIKHQERCFEFVFTSLNKTTFQVYGGVARVYAAYDKTRLYRDLELRGALLTDGELNTLAFEQFYSKVNGVWNLCSAEGNLGTLFVSSVRVVWYSDLDPSCSMSLPYIQVQHIKVRDSKFGPALVLESSKSSGAHVLSFKVDPKETLDYIHKEILSLWKAYKQQPFLGIDSEVQASACSEALAAQPSGFSFTSQKEDVKTLDAESRGDIIEAYFADSFTNQGVVRAPVYPGHLELTAGQL